MARRNSPFPFPSDDNSHHPWYTASYTIHPSTSSSIPCRLSNNLPTRIFAMMMAVTGGMALKTVYGT
uniref:Uncharacterized protein n=1 Tax=Ditylenchus dipsaci TaxID=166011 RepID=A0A915E213_9BILA